LSIFFLGVGSSSAFASTGPSNPVSTATFGGGQVVSHVSLNVPQIVKGVTQLCSTGDFVAGIYPGPGGGVFSVELSTGNLVWCSSGVSTVIATPPGGPSYGYYGMAGVKTGIGLVLVMSNPYDGPGLWFCFGATPTGCAVESTHITLPSSFCLSLTLGACYDQGVALDNKLNLYAADDGNSVVYKCTYASAYQTCNVIENLSAGNPIYIFRDTGGNLWVSDYSCNGYVWENGVVKYTVGDSLYGITISKSNLPKANHVYVGVSGTCTGLAPSILDLHDGNSLPIVGFSSGDGITLTTNLRFASFFGGTIYKTVDKL
jgi:hypothetical protein